MREKTAEREQNLRAEADAKLERRRRARSVVASATGASPRASPRVSSRASSPIVMCAQTADELATGDELATAGEEASPLMERARTRLEALLVAATDAVSASNAPPAEAAEGVASSLRSATASLERGLIEREGEARLLLLALVGGEHLLLLGPPGTAKSELCRRLSGLCGLSYFERTLTRFSTPEELFGPLSLSALERDEFRCATLTHATPLSVPRSPMRLPYPCHAGVSRTATRRAPSSSS